MSSSISYSGLITDFYELTMLQGYHHTGKNPQVVFDMYFRKNPFSGGYTVFAGLKDLLLQLSSLSFSEEDIEYLRGLGTFGEPFLTDLSEFGFRGDVYSVEEGTIVFPGEPVVRVHAMLMEAQLIESILLNTINFQTLIATKAARIKDASKGGKLLEFGLRRAQGLDGAHSAARAAFIGGADATSFTEAGKKLGIPVKGTMAHSWVMAFDTELESFRAYAELYPENTILLIDTYDTLGSGIENAITVGLELKEKGHSMGVRLDSGDLQYLSQKVRKRLDEAGLNDAVIAASNDLNEEIINQLVTEHSPIDIWGVGTHLVTGGSQSHLPGVYKLAARQVKEEMEPVIKVSNNPEKTTNPGVKQVYRFLGDEDSPIADLIACDEEEIVPGERFVFHHPMHEKTYFVLEPKDYREIKPLLQPVMKEGKPLEGPLEEGTDQGTTEKQAKSLKTIQERRAKNQSSLDTTYRRLINPHRYKVSLSGKLRDRKVAMIENYSNGSNA